MNDLEPGNAGRPEMPSKVKAIGWLHLFGAVSNIGWGLFWTLYGGIAALGTFGLGLIFCCPVFIVFPVACLELYSAFRILSGAKGLKPPKMTSIAELSTVVVCNTFSTIPGILTLLFQSDPEVMAFYARSAEE